MGRLLCAVWLTACGVVPCTGCGSPSGAAPVVSQPSAAEVKAAKAPSPAAQLPADDETVGGDFPQRLLRIAARYRNYSLVDRHWRWSPTMCAAPPPPRPSISEAAEETWHGRKLYYLFAKQFTDYCLGNDSQPIGQVVVKESWVPEEVTTPVDQAPAKHASGRDVVPYAEHDGKTYRPGKQSDLFIMFKTPPGTYGTDDGWVYGTVTHDGQRVTSVGALESCMECHRQAKHDRLFGMKPATDD